MCDQQFPYTFHLSYGDREKDRNQLYSLITDVVGWSHLVLRWPNLIQLFLVVQELFLSK